MGTGEIDHEWQHHRLTRWNYGHILPDDGMSNGGDVEQLTDLLFLQMTDERTKAPYYHKSPVPDQYT